MNEQNIRGLIEEVREGKLARRDFMTKMVSLGLAAPFAGHLLLNAGIAQAQTPSTFKPTKRGGGGALKVLWWQGATLLNPHFATGTKDQDGCRIFYEPLASWDKDGNLIPNLAAEIPSAANGGLSKDGKTVIWKLKRGVTWHDGKPFTSADVVFNWEYASDPATAAVSIGSYKDMKVEATDSHTVKITFNKVTPFWAIPFVGGAQGSIIPKHLFEAYKGAKSRESPNNLKPVGTGPFKFVDFTPGDMVRGTINTAYHEANKPFFDSVEMKGGGDSVSAARAVLQTGEYDFAWNLQVEDEILLKLEAGGKGKVVVIPSGDIEFIQCNFTDPNIEIDGERSSIKTKHPVLTDPSVRQALSLLVDRASVQKFIYGRAGIATADFINNPPRLRSTANKPEFNVDKAIAVLEAGGWKKGGDGIREKGGKKLKFVFQTSVNQPRQKTQAIIKQACQKAGIELELKAITAAVFFSSDVGNPDTYTKLYSDLQMYTTTMNAPDAEIFMNQYVSWEFATKANKWQGRNSTRWSNPDYDALYKAAQGELDPVKRASMYIKMNDMVVQDHAVVPVVSRPRARGANLKLRFSESGWDSDFWALQDWHREA
ncbi:MAG: peptide ABC transporter substrate-binding protein [Casimicrobium sp.]